MCLAGLEEQQLTLSLVSVGGGSVTALWFSSPGPVSLSSAAGTGERSWRDALFNADY